MNRQYRLSSSHRDEGREVVRGWESLDCGDAALAVGATGRLSAAQSIGMRTVGSVEGGSPLTVVALYRLGEPRGMDASVHHPCVDEVHRDNRGRDSLGGVGVTPTGRRGLEKKRRNEIRRDVQG